MDSVLGFTGDELIQLLKDFIGNQSPAFVRFMTAALPLAERRFCKAHDWSFLNKNGLTLTTVPGQPGTTTYTLNVASIGYVMKSTNVRTIYDPAKNLVLKKLTLDQIRRMDPDSNDGGTTSGLTHWAPGDDNSIVVYPPKFDTTALKIDGKITASNTTTTANYPVIPFDYQESFIEYLKWIALSRENDERADKQLLVSTALIKQDIADDLSMLGDTDQARVKSLNEQQTDGVSADLTALYNFWMFYSY